MCGIAGEIRFDGGVGDAVRMRRMLLHLRRRGPDGHHVFTDGAVALAHTRLAIIDLSPAGEQPMVDEELGLVLVFNGVIYNYRELRSELSAFGYRFFSDSDSEVILKAYHRWGDDCPRRLDGIFAFAVWDRNARSLLLARDRLGIKPSVLRARCAASCLCVEPAGVAGRGRRGYRRSIRWRCITI